MKYDCYVELVPRGKSPHNAKTLKMIEFKIDNLRRPEIVSELYETVDRRNDLEPYVIRNYWDIFEIDVDHTNPPWDSLSELCGKLISFDEATGWKYSGNIVYTSVADGKESSYISKIQDYYNPLNPRPEKSGIVAVDAKPEIKE